MMKVFGSIVGLALLLVSAQCLLPPSKDDLSQISLLGMKYLDKQIENAISGVKEMKTVMERSGEDHEKFLSALEKTTQQKEDALKAAQEMETKLSDEQEVCNGTMQSLWEECKPCLKNTCIKYYSRTCSSGAGLVGRQLEEVLNRTSPFSIWINGENMDVLEREDQEQSWRFQNLEERYSNVADGVDSIFTDSMRVFDHMRSLNPPMFPSPYRMPSIWGQGERANERAKAEGSVNEDVVVTKPSGMTCREIRRNSAGCIKLRGECEKCVAIQDIDCSGKKPLTGPLKEELEQALAMAEKFTQEYNKQLRRFEEKMSNTSSLLDLFSKQFGWVSALANNTDTKDGIFKIETVMSKDTEDPEKPGDTNVSVQLFNTPAMTFSVPGDITWNDPKFSEVVAQEALDRYKQRTVVVK
ncbi:clusterin-like isoform X2 [Oncorhynchus kisutch]|uniref:clusterin-like isoform X2 n=1 Tax=Oncorhynchus kisutch TaxID=8019 RepID=UPI0012DC4110|nr:clusterin-like isoform X2 [Oncorhynchus kisutch]